MYNDIKAVRSVIIVKKYISVVYAFIIVFMSLFPRNAHALDFDPCYVELEWSNAPKHTAYIDILVKMDTDDENYVDFTVPPKKLAEKYIENGTSKYRYESLPIGRNSEIAQLNDDGWVSLSLHHKSSGSITIQDNAVFCLNCCIDEDGIKQNSDILSCSIFTISKDYGRFKCAYVDEQGNVLGITDKSKKILAKASYAVIADGDDLTFRVFEFLPIKLIILILISAAALLVLLVKKIVNKINYIRRCLK